MPPTAPRAPSAALARQVEEEKGRIVSDEGMLWWLNQAFAPASSPPRKGKENASPATRLGREGLSGCADEHEVVEVGADVVSVKNGEQTVVPTTVGMSVKVRREGQHLERSPAGAGSPRVLLVKNRRSSSSLHVGGEMREGTGQIVTAGWRGNRVSMLGARESDTLDDSSSHADREELRADASASRELEEMRGHIAELVVARSGRFGVEGSGIGARSIAR